VTFLPGQPVADDGTWMIRAANTLRRRRTARMLRPTRCHQTQVAIGLVLTANGRIATAKLCLAPDIAHTLQWAAGDVSPLQKVLFPLRDQGPIY